MKKTKRKTKRKEPNDQQVALWLLNDCMNTIRTAITSKKVDNYIEENDEFVDAPIDSNVSEFLFNLYQQLDSSRDRFIKSL